MTAIAPIPDEPATDEKRPHPAQFTPACLAAAVRLLDPHLTPGALVVDPFAGVGTRFHAACKKAGWTSVGIELEPEWAAQHPNNRIGDARGAHFERESVDAVLTSPSYANRMADSYDGRDGSRRMTYRLSLGRELSDGNSGGMQWGKPYRLLHVAVWRAMRDALKPGGHLALNISDHIRDGRRVGVSAWHVSALLELGFTLVGAETVGTRRMKHGANSEARVNGELVILFERGGPETLGGML